MTAPRFDAHSINVEGYSAGDPIPEEDWEDEVRWQVTNWWRDRRVHDQNGFLCDLAGSEACRALGHRPDADGGYDELDDGHQFGFDGDVICPATRFGKACTQCEGECLWNDWFDPAALWSAVSR